MQGPAVQWDVDVEDAQQVDDDDDQGSIRDGFTDIIHLPFDI
jgi:hypothetical protein